MILQALTAYYDAMLTKGKISPPGWGVVKVAFALELDDSGAIVGLHSMKVPTQSGKKEVLLDQILEVPLPEKRSSGVLPNFLCDNAGYILGADDKGKPERTKKCFAACAKHHLSVLEHVTTPAANAVKHYFRTWNPADAQTHPALSADWEALMEGGNLVFYYDRVPVLVDPAIRLAWQLACQEKGDEPEMQCLVTGTQSHIPSIHASIKGVRDAQSSGAALVSFNAPAFESYNRSQNLNAPIGSHAAFAYTTALNQLLADREHTLYLGDTTVVFWSETGESAYADFAKMSMMGISAEEQTDSVLRRALGALSTGQSFEWQETMLDPTSKFYVLGLAPNAARLSVRFFLQDSFGAFASHSKLHYDQLEIVRPSYDRFETLPLWKLLDETVNQNARNKAASPQMSGDVLRAVWDGTPYPGTLLNGVMLRIRAERDVTRGRAAILKAYYSRNQHPLCPKEVLTVSLNEESTNIPYVLGRMFSVLEAIQQAASPGINTTIKDKYFNSASATPANIFPVLGNLSQKHLRKLDAGKRIYWEKQLGRLSDLLPDSYPPRLTLPEQGSFHLGYYHQTQKRYEKKEEN